MMMALAPRRPINPFKGFFLPAPVGRHRRGRVPLRLIALGAAYVALWSAFSTYATLAGVS